jgi:hypothetical protein
VQACSGPRPWSRENRISICIDKLEIVGKEDPGLAEFNSWGKRYPGLADFNSWGKRYPRLADFDDRVKFP